RGLSTAMVAMVLPPVGAYQQPPVRRSALGQLDRAQPDRERPLDVDLLVPCRLGDIDVPAIDQLAHQQRRHLRVEHPVRRDPGVLVDTPLEQLVLPPGTRRQHLHGKLQRPLDALLTDILAAYHQNVWLERRASIGPEVERREEHLGLRWT